MITNIEKSIFNVGDNVKSYKITETKTNWNNEQLITFDNDNYDNYECVFYKLYDYPGNVYAGTETWVKFAGRNMRGCNQEGDKKDQTEICNSFWGPVGKIWKMA